MVQEVPYYHCQKCAFIYADPDLLEKMDHGQPILEYNDNYWRRELPSARTRAFGSSLARLAEAVLYTRIPIQKVLDVGTGPGYLLDAISAHLPQNSQQFHGVEKFPPPPEFRSAHPNYHLCGIEDLGVRFECGTCIEVLEHLTPNMARGLAQSLAEVSVPGTLFVFNTGLVDHVLNTEPGYLDPFGRGHITCWSTSAARAVFGDAGFVVHPIPGKNWAFAIEFQGGAQGDIRNRIWTAPKDNADLLKDPALGDVMYILGRESARAYGQ